MKFKMSQHGVEALMLVFNNGFVNMIAGKDADMTDVFKNLEWFVNDEEQLVCDNPPMFDLSILADFIGEEE